MRARTSSTDSAVKRPCTEQWPRHKIILARSSCSRVRPPLGRCGFHTTQSSRDMPISSTAVLRPRCWSGRNSTFCPRVNAQSSARRALEEVQTAPPFLPQNALMSALEFMYVTGTTWSASPASSSASQHSSTWSNVAMSAIEQPAARSGRTTFWPAPVRMSADSAMKCTPQKTMNSAPGRAAACWASLNESPVTSANWMTSSRW